MVSQRGVTTFFTDASPLCSRELGDVSHRSFASAATVSTRSEVDGLWSARWIAFVWSSVPAAVVVTMASSRLMSEQVALSLIAISFVGLNLMHMAATWTRVYVRPGWRVNPFERLTVPLSLATFAVLFESIGGGALLLALQYFLSFHHALMQNYGLVRASQRRGGRAVDPRLDLAACLLLPGAALLHRADRVCHEYSGAPLPSIPPLLIEAMMIGGVVALGAFLWRDGRPAGAVSASIRSVSGYFLVRTSSGPRS